MNIEQIDKTKIKEYIKMNIKHIKKKVVNWNDIKISLLDSEKKRAFLINIDGVKIFMKINLPFWDEENSRCKMLNEKEALEILNRRGIKNIPKIYKFEANSYFFNTETLLMSYIMDTETNLNRNHILKLARLVNSIHSITSKSFTVPFGNFINRINGNGYDFLNSYLDVLEKDIKFINNFYFVRKLQLENFLIDIFVNIRKKTIKYRDSFKETKIFSLLHGHIARNIERKHILIDENDQIYLIDWENVCFGEREMELASFIYENNSLNFYLKKYFFDLLNHNGTLNFKKIFIYMILLRLDDLIEDLKKYIYYLKEKNILIKVESLWVIFIDKRVC